MELNNETKWTDGEPVKIDDNGMIQLLDTAEAKLAEMPTGEPITVETFERMRDEALIDLGRLRMLNEIVDEDIARIKGRTCDCGHKDYRHIRSGFCDTCECSNYTTEAIRRQEFNQ